MGDGDRLAAGKSSDPSAEAALLLPAGEGGSHMAGLVPGNRDGAENHRMFSIPKGINLPIQLTNAGLSLQLL